MAYTLCYVVDFGPANTGLTLNAKLFDAVGAQVGATITTGFVNYSDGSYSYLATIPDGQVGSFVIYDSALATRKSRFSVNPQEAGIVALVDGAITAAKIASNAITAAKIATDAIDADALSTDAVSEIQAGLATTAALAVVVGYVDTEVASILSAVTTILAATDTEIATLVTNVAAILAQTGTDGVVLSTAVKQAIADEVLKRGMSHVDSATPDTLSLYDLIASILNGSMLGGVWTAHKSAGATFTTHTLTTDAAALPVTGVSN